MEQEGFSYEELSFDSLCEKMKVEGWNYMGVERLTETKFDGLFREIPFQTEASIKEKYLKNVRENDHSLEWEVALVLNTNTEKLRGVRKVCGQEEYQKILDNLRDEDKTYFVFVRKVKK